MTREEAIYTLEQMKTWSKDLSDDEIEALVIALKALEQASCFWEKCPYYESDIMFDGKDEYDMGKCKYKQEPKTDTWSIKDVADTLSKHGLMTEQESCEDCIERNEEFFKKWVNCKIFDKIQTEIDREYKWLMNTRYTIHDVNIAFGSILGIIDRYRGESEGDDE